MQSFNLTAKKQDEEKITPPRIDIRNRGGKFLATIWADERISFNSEIDFFIEEIEIFAKLSKDFFTIFNSLIEKDEEIERLEKELNQINNPILLRHEKIKTVL